MRKSICYLIIIINILSIGLSLYTFHTLGRVVALLVALTQVTQQQHERVGALERELRINTTSAPSRSINRRTMTVTAYTAGPESTGKLPGHPEYGITAAGHNLTDQDAWKVAAADPKYWPAGTRMYLAGVGIVTVKDTGSDIKGPDRLDLFVGMTDVSAANDWGAKRVPVMILGGSE